MNGPSTARRRLVALLGVATIVAAACSSSTSSTAPSAEAPSAGAPSAEAPSAAAPSMGSEDLSGQTVTVIGTWGGDEEKNFKAMVAPWEQQTGATVSYTGTRDLNTVLTTGVASGVLPDLAGLPGPGQMAEWADSLVDLSGVLDVPTYTAETAAPLVELGKVNGKMVGVFIKSAVKGLIWFNPSAAPIASPPANWDALQGLITANASGAKSPWCLGIFNGAATGWPATDWIEDLVLRQAGPDVYDSWWQGKTKWSDPAIKQAWQTFGDVVKGSYGGPDAVAATAFETAGDPLFTSPPGCQFFHQASFITGLGEFPNKTAGTDYDFFQFPDINAQYTGAVEGAGDLFGMFHDTPAAKSLMAYLVTAPAQDIWVKAGGALSANKNATSYPDEISKRSAEILQNAKIFAFDASDLMPSAMNDAFWKGVTDYVKDPSKLDSILNSLDATQADAYAQ